MQLRYLIWSDISLPLEQIMKLKPYQRVNHFPGMIEICRKDYLTKNFSRMQKVEPDEYNFMPNTWILPQEYGYFSNYIRNLYRQGCNACFIQKPANGAMGQGIRLYCNLNKLSGNIINNHSHNINNLNNNNNNNTNCLISVIQEYIERPLLIDGYKFDLRVYVLVTSCDPLRIFIYNDGLVRLSAEKYIYPYEPNGDSIYRQLTNYAVNRHHSQYHRTTDDLSGSKRSFNFFNHYLYNVKKTNPMLIWDKIYDLIIKTLIIALPHLVHFYRIVQHKSNQNTTNTTTNTTYTTDNNNNNNDKYTFKQFPTINKIRQPIRISSSSPSSPPHTAAGTTPATTTPATTTTPAASTPAATTNSTSKIYSQPMMMMTLFQSNLFEILGFDILIDNQLNPWLIEVNRSPSYNIDQKLDKQIKYNLLMDTIRLLNIKPSDKSSVEKQQKLLTRKRLYSSQSVQTQNWMYSSLSSSPSSSSKHKNRINRNRNRNNNNNSNNNNNNSNNIYKYFRRNNNNNNNHNNNNNVQSTRNCQSSLSNYTNCDYMKLLLNKNNNNNNNNAYAKSESRKFNWKINCLKQQLYAIRQQLSIDFYEHQNSGNWYRIFPNENIILQKKYTSLILTSFQQFFYTNQNNSYIMNEMKTTYLNPITEDDIYNELSKLIKQELKMKPGINAEKYLAELWSHCIDNHDISDANEFDDAEDDDDDGGTNDDNDYNHNNNEQHDNLSGILKQHNENIHLRNNHFIKSSNNRKLKTMSTITTKSSLNHINLKKSHYSAPVSPCPNQMSNNKSCRSSLNIERHLKHANKRIQTTGYSNNSIHYYDDVQRVGHVDNHGDDADDQCAIGHGNSTNLCLPYNNTIRSRFDKKKVNNNSNNNTKTIVRKYFE
ncbi:unnamed protein product [Schistosoma turkestanicum]|nr:unnamed protein product [Schistosoma turkestanicum]